MQAEQEQQALVNYQDQGLEKTREYPCMPTSQLADNWQPARGAAHTRAGWHRPRMPGAILPAPPRPAACRSFHSLGPCLCHRRSNSLQVSPAGLAMPAKQRCRCAAPRRQAQLACVACLCLLQMILAHVDHRYHEAACVHPSTLTCGGTSQQIFLSPDSWAHTCRLTWREKEVSLPSVCSALTVRMAEA